MSPQTRTLQACPGFERLATLPPATTLRAGFRGSKIHRLVLVPTGYRELAFRKTVDVGQPGEILRIRGPMFSESRLAEATGRENRACRSYERTAGDNDVQRPSGHGCVLRWREAEAHPLTRSK